MLYREIPTKTKDLFLCCMFFFTYCFSEKESKEASPNKHHVTEQLYLASRTLGMAPSMLGMFLNAISGISFIYSLEVGNLDLLQVVGKKYNIFPNWWWKIGIYHGRIRKTSPKN